MNPLPSLLVVADRGRLVAYLVDESGTPSVRSTLEIQEGNEKISELVTDQAGAFPNPGNVGTSSFERLPLERELEARCFRQLATAIGELVAAEGIPIWGLSAPPQIMAAIVDQLQREVLEPLAIRVSKDLVNAPPQDVKEAFEKAAEVAHAS